MGRKSIKNTLMAVMIAAVLGAGASAVQLQKKAGILPICRGTCSATQPCFGGCLCQDFGSTKACVRDPGPVRPQPQKN